MGDRPFWWRPFLQDLERAERDSGKYDGMPGPEAAHDALSALRMGLGGAELSDLLEDRDEDHPVQLLEVLAVEVGRGIRDAMKKDWTGV